jgi:FKBP-type peptidyl-prolyl cis-trans isomerase
LQKTRHLIKPTSPKFAAPKVLLRIQLSNMKTYFILFALMVTNLSVNAQVKQPAKPVVKAVNPLKNLLDSASYAIGVSVGSFYKQQGLTKLNTALITRAINDILSNKKSLMSEQEGTDVMNRYMTQLQEQKAKSVIDSGKAFLARNKKRPEVKTTASGLQYEVITEGTGIKPAVTDTITAHYRGTLVNGLVVDASYDRGAPMTIAVNRLITGWTEGLQLMSVGSKYKFYIPYNLGYGSFDNGPIPGGSTLIFEVELLDVKKAQ